MNAVLCFDLIRKKPDPDTPVKRHFMDCPEVKKHRNRMEKEGDAGTMFWSEEMPSASAEAKGKDLATRLGVNYEQCQRCARAS